MTCAGYNVSKKRRARGVIGKKHRVSCEEAMKWFQQKVGAADLYEIFIIRYCFPLLTFFFIFSQR